MISKFVTQLPIGEKISQYLNFLLFQLFSHSLFLLPMIISLKSELSHPSRRAPVYMYRFSYDGHLGWFKNLMWGKKEKPKGKLENVRSFFASIMTVQISDCLDFRVKCDKYQIWDMQVLQVSFYINNNNYIGRYPCMFSQSPFQKPNMDFTFSCDRQLDIA